MSDWKERRNAANEFMAMRRRAQAAEARAEAAEAALASQQPHRTDKPGLISLIDNLRARAQAAEARAHELSIKYVVALNRVKELEEKLNEARAP